MDMIKSTRLSWIVTLNLHACLWKMHTSTRIIRLARMLSSRYVILGLGTLCHQIKLWCSICKEERAKAFTQQQAALPLRRLGEKTRPFCHVGMDFAGPFEVKVGRGKPRKKLYILILTCMSIRAVHLEPTGGMDTTHVINAISCFTDMRSSGEDYIR
jgi:hypothetical protein